MQHDPGPEHHARNTHTVTNYTNRFLNEVDGISSKPPASQNVELAHYAADAAREMLVNLAGDGSDVRHVLCIASDAHSAGTLRARGVHPQWASRYQIALADEHLAPQLLPHGVCSRSDSATVLDTVICRIPGQVVLKQLRPNRPNAIPQA